MYRTIETSFWDDPKFNGAHRDVLFVASYLITNPDSHVSGLYVLRPSLAREHLRMPQSRIDECLDILCNQGFCKWDADRKIIWVVNMFKRQSHHGLNMRAVASYLKGLFESPLIAEFLDKYAEYKIPFTPITTCTPPVHHVSTTCGETGGVDQDQDQELDQDQDIKNPQISDEIRPRIISANSQIYNRFVESRRKALDVPEWKPTAKQAIVMRANIKKLLQTYPLEDLLDWLDNYFDDVRQAKNKWTWGLWSTDPITWSTPFRPYQPASNDSFAEIDKWARE